MELLFLALLIFLMAYALGSGYPVAFALPGSAIISIGLAAFAGYLFTGDPDAYFAQDGPMQWLSAGVTNLRGVYWEPERDTLIAIPLFIFMGIMLQRSKIAEDLLVTMAQLFGPVPGGLGISVVMVGALLAATTGIVGATVVAMGLISLPAMLKQNYSKSLATGTIAASGTLGQIIPPSIVLIILADQLASAVDQADTARKALYKASTGELSMPSEFAVISTSAGDMFLGAFVPGLVLVALYILYILVFSVLRPAQAPAVPYEGKYNARFAGRVLLILIPPLTLIFLVLGSIIGGIATVNQAGAIGSAGALIMAGYRLYPNRRTTFYPAILALVSLAGLALVLSRYTVNIRNVVTAEDQMALTLACVFVTLLAFSLLWSGWRTLKIENTMREVMLETAKTTSLVFIILLGAAMLTAAFRAFGGEELVKHFLEGLPGGFWTKFIIVMLVIFVLGFFLDFIEIAVVVVPIVTPILLADPSANVTAVWLGVMIGLNIQTSFLTPPFGFALFYLRGVAPAVVKTLDMYKGVIFFIGLQILALIIVGFNPALVNYLPNRASLTADTAPPPLNPSLQYCIEQYVSEEFAENEQAIRRSIDAIERVDLSYIPPELADDLREAFQTAKASFAGMDAIIAAENAVQKEADNFRPIHTLVRGLERDIRVLENNIADAEQKITRAKGNEELKESAQQDINRLNDEIEALRSLIPTTWDAAQTAYSELTKAERTARSNYRRQVDNAATPIKQIILELEVTQAFLAAKSDIDKLVSDLNGVDDDAAIELIREQENALKKIEGTRSVQSLLAQARRALRGRSPDRDEGNERVRQAVLLYEAESLWRARAADQLFPALLTYQAAIADTIGLRQQAQLPKKQALYVAACRANHRNIGLNF